VKITAITLNDARECLQSASGWIHEDKRIGTEKHATDCTCNLCKAYTCIIQAQRALENELLARAKAKA
jgi:hypothetical protein